MMACTKCFSTKKTTKKKRFIELFCERAQRKPRKISEDFLYDCWIDYDFYFCCVWARLMMCAGNSIKRVRFLVHGTVTAESINRKTLMSSDRYVCVCIIFLGNIQSVETEPIKNA